MLSSVRNSSTNSKMLQDMPHYSCQHPIPFRESKNKKVTLKFQLAISQTSNTFWSWSKLDLEQKTGEIPVETRLILSFSFNKLKEFTSRHNKNLAIK